MSIYPTSQRTIRNAFWLLTALPIVLGLLAFRSATSLVRSVQDVARTNELEKQLERLHSRIKDIDAAALSYVLTADPHHLDTIKDLKDVIETGVRAVSGVTVDKEWVELLNAAKTQKFDEVSKAILLRQVEGIESAAEYVSKDRGDQPMESLRDIFRNLIRREEEELARRTERQDSEFVTTMVLFGALLVLNLAVIGTTAMSVRRDAERTSDINTYLERRVAERTEALQRSNEDLQQFAYIASHDLKEPLRMISSYATLLQRKYTGRLDSDAEIYTGFIVDAAKRMNALIGDLLEYSRAAEEVQNELVLPEEAIKTALDNLKATVAESGAQITQDALPSVQYDSMRLCQIFQNLISNSIKYRSERNPLIHISAVQNATEHIFSVSDNSIGIEEQYLKQIFAIFKRLHGKKYDGTGIGLAMVEKIVERHGGRIWAESTPGEGSTFYFTIPINKAIEPRASA